MPKSTGYILDTPLQRWSAAGEIERHSLLSVEIERAMMKHSCFVVVENTRGLLKSTVLQSALDELEQSGYMPMALGAERKTIIIGQKR